MVFSAMDHRFPAGTYIMENLTALCYPILDILQKVDKNGHEFRQKMAKIRLGTNVEAR